MELIVKNDTELGITGSIEIELELNNKIIILKDIVEIIFDNRIKNVTLFKYHQMIHLQ